MTSNRKLFKNISYLSIAELTGKGLQAFYTIYLANVITAQGFGIYGFAQSIITYFVIFVSFGIDTYGNREAAKYPEKISDFVNDILSLRLALSVFAYLILLVTALSIDKEPVTTSAILILGINIFSNALLLNWAFQGLERMEIIAVRQVGVGIINLAGIFLLVNSFEDTLTALWIIAVSTLLNSFLMIGIYARDYKPVKLNLNFSRWKSIARKSLPIGIFGILVIVFNNIDLTMIGFFIKDYQQPAGIYNAAFRILVFAMLPSIIIQNAFFPELSRTEDSSERQEIMNKYTKLSFLTGALIAVLVFGYAEFGIDLLLGQDYQSSIPILKIFGLTIFFGFLNVTFTAPMVAWQNEKKPLYASIAALITNVGLNIFMIPVYGIIGAAIATVLSEIALFIVISYFMYDKVQSIFSKNLFGALSISLISILPAYLYLNKNLGNIAGLIFTILLFLVITHFSGFLKIFNYEKLFKR